MKKRTKEKKKRRKKRKNERNEKKEKKKEKKIPFTVIPIGQTEISTLYAYINTECYIKKDEELEVS